MCRNFDNLPSLLAHGFDTVIDVRSPSEYAEDHIPEAVNLPVLNDIQRAEVGGIYVRNSPFLARKIGAAMVYRNSAHHLETNLIRHDGNWRPLVYCWRGGQRSGSFTHLLRQIGWRAEALKGGYKTWRSLVKRMLYDSGLPFRLVKLDGNTGTGKTELLHLLAECGVQTIDLESAAHHRGSLLGDLPGGQPSQKAFETTLANVLGKLDAERPVLVEAESNRIGQRIIPPSIWEAMKHAPRIEITVPKKARTAYLVQTYGDILSDSEGLRHRLASLRPHRGNAVVEEWLRLIECGKRSELVSALISQHYDPTYSRSRRLATATPMFHLDSPDCDSAARRILAEKIKRALNSRFWEKTDSIRSQAE